MIQLLYIRRLSDSAEDSVLYDLRNYSIKEAVEDFCFVSECSLSEIKVFFAYVHELDWEVFRDELQDFCD